MLTHVISFQYFQKLLSQLHVLKITISTWIIAQKEDESMKEILFKKRERKREKEREKDREIIVILRLKDNKKKILKKKIQIIKYISCQIWNNPRN